MTYTIKLSTLGQIEFSPHINLHPDKKWEIALTHGLVSKSWDNISPLLGNNEFTYNSITYALEGGHYDLDALVEEIRELTGVSTIELIPRRHSGGLKIINNSANTVVLTTLAPVLGFTNPTTALAGTSGVSPNKADFSGGIHEIEFHCDLVDRRFTRHQGRTSNLINSIIADSQPHGHISVNRDIHFVPMTNKPTLSLITLELKDQLGRDINIQQNHGEFVLVIREAK